MQIKLDPRADALYIKMQKGKTHKTVSHGSYLIDLNKSGKVIGIEVLNYSKVNQAKSGEFSVSIRGRQKTPLVPAI